MKLTIENGFIKSADIVLGDYAMEMRIDIEGRGYGVCFGGYSIGFHTSPYANKKETKYGNYAAYYIASVLSVAERYSVAALNNTPVRTIFNGNTCVGIMNFLDPTKLFIPAMNNPDFDISDLKAIMSDFDFKKFMDKMDKEINGKEAC